MPDASTKSATVPRGSLLSAIIAWFAAGPDAEPLTDRAAMDRLYRARRWAIGLSLTIAYAAAYTCRIGQSVVKKDLIDGGVFTPRELGAIGSVWLASYGIAKLTNGLLADHANVKRLLPAALLGSAAVNIVVGGWPDFTLWLVLWALNGLWQGFLAPGSVVSISQWFSNRERGRMYGTWSMAHSLGEALVFLVSTYLVAFLGWQAAFVGPGVFCIIVAVAFYFALSDRPETLGLPNVADWKNDHAAKDVSHAESAVRRVQSLALRTPAVWVVGLASAAIYVPRYAINNWGILYLQEAKGYALAEAGRFLTINNIAGVFGCLAIGFVSDQLFAARRQPANLLFGACQVLSIVAFFFMPSGHPYLLGAAVAVHGFALHALVTSLGGLFAVDLCPKRAAGTAMGVVGVMSYAGASVQDFVTGSLLGRDATVIDGVRHYDFLPAITFWISASVLSLLLATSLWRAKPVD